MNELLRHGVRAGTELVHELFEQRASARPSATALVFGERRWTYQELNRRANQLAHELARRGVGEGARVLVVVEPGFEIALALLAIFKSGATYVPLDPGYPPARMQAIVDDTRPQLVLGQRRLCERLHFDAVETLALDDAAPAYAQLSQENPGIFVDPQQIATIFYTSGTTGNPKGVLASYANLRHYLRVARERYELGPRDVMPALARFSFSISPFELLSPLTSGGTLLVLEREHVLDPARLAQALESVSFFHAGPSLLRGLTAYIRGHYRSFQAFSKVRHASSGGDTVPPELLETLKEIFTNAEVFVIYGCSEISCMGCTFPVPRGRTLERTYVGKPFTGVSLKLLDDAGASVGTGAVGEVCFAGDGVTQGYLNRPELTAEKFITLDGRRYYRSGDRGRLSEDGLLELLGRNDFQVKLRGMRVELGEVEAALRRAPGVLDAAAAAKTARDGEKVLVAYVVLEQGVDPLAAARAQRMASIREYLAGYLPDYMLPSAYVELAALPLNHNLKLDRRALPEPSEADFRALSPRRLREPRTQSEKTLARLWQKLLTVEAIGLDDNFFELGGHSMLAVMLGLEVEDALGVRLKGMDVLREPLEVLADICDRARPSDTADTARVPGPLEPEAQARSAQEPVEVFHLGCRGSLYGVLHGRADAASSRAVLICGPVGQEALRARFVLTQLAKRLARSGVPALLFDYYGCGDSLGESYDAGPTCWQHDIVDACAELRRRAPNAQITALGVRLGGLLLARATAELTLEKCVLWSPVSDGAAHFAELTRMQRRYLRSVAPLRAWSGSRPEPHELLGTRYAPQTLDYLSSLELEPLLAHSGTPAARADFECGWRDVGRLEDVIPDVGISAALTELILGRA